MATVWQSRLDDERFLSPHGQDLRRQDVILVTVVFVLIFSLHLAYLFFIEIPHRAVHPARVDFLGVPLNGDEVDYVQIGYNICHKGVFGYGSQGSLTARRPPLWPAVVSIVFRFTDNLVYLMIVNHGLFALVSVGAYFFASRFFSPKTSLLAMMVVGLNPNSFSYVRLYSEALFALLLMVAMIFFALLISGNKPRYYLLGGLFTGLLALTRAEGVLLIVFFFLYLLYHSWRGRLKMPAALMFLLVAVMLVTPWVLRNYTVTGFPGIASNSGEVFVGAHNSKIFASNPGRWLNFNESGSPEQQARRHGLSEAEDNSYLWQLGLEALRNADLLFIIKLQINKLLITFLPYFVLLPAGYPQIINVLSALPYNILWVLFLAFALKWLYTGEKWRVFLIPFLAPLLVTFVFYGSSRFRVPYEPLALTLTIGYLMVRFIHRAHPGSLKEGHAATAIGSFSANRNQSLARADIAHHLPGTGE